MAQPPTIFQNDIVISVMIFSDEKPIGHLRQTQKISWNWILAQSKLDKNPRSASKLLLVNIKRKKQLFFENNSNGTIKITIFK